MNRRLMRLLAVNAFLLERWASVALAIAIAAAGGWVLADWLTS